MANISGKKGNSMRFILVVLALFAILGILFTASLMPNGFLKGPSTNSLLKESLSDSTDLVIGDLSRSLNDELPDWKTEFWSPIDVEVSADSMITLCKLNYKQYWRSPHTAPMFKDLEGLSKCRGSNRKRQRISVLMKELEEQKDTPAGNVVKPTGFVFHESRVGSTLIANFLASDPFSLMFSESAPLANAILHCTSCSRQQHIQLIRDVVTLMGRSPIHKRLFFKLQSITSTKMDLVLEAFPETPWAFVFRQPVQTMMSHLDPERGSNAAPCLRSKRNPPPEVSNAIKKVTTGSLRGKTPNEAWCAAHLNMLCTSALRAYDSYSTMTVNGAAKQRGLLVNYESLPGSIASALLPLFSAPLSQSWLEKMNEEAQQYSKSRGGHSQVFTGDSADKDNRATENIQKYAQSILGESYTTLDSKSLEGFKALVPELHSVWDGGADKPANWASIKTLATDVRHVIHD